MPERTGERLVNLLISQRPEARGGSIAFDAKETETHVRPLDVSEYPVQAGSASDHIQPRQYEVTIEGIVSETPFETQPNDIPGQTTFQPRSQTLSNWLEDHKVGLFTWVSSRFGTIRNLALTEIKREIPKAQAIELSLSLVQVEEIRSQIVDIPPEFVPPAFRPRQECVVQGAQDITDLANGDGGSNQKPASIAANLDLTTRGRISDIATSPVRFFSNLF